MFNPPHSFFKRDSFSGSMEVTACEREIEPVEGEREGEREKRERERET